MNLTHLSQKITDLNHSLRGAVASSVNHIHIMRNWHEIEGIAGCWSVPQLKRQIESLLFERTRISKNKKKLIDTAHKENKPATIDDLIRDPYILEFSGFPERSVYSESDLETALLDHVAFRKEASL